MWSVSYGEGISRVVSDSDLSLESGIWGDISCLLTDLGVSANFSTKLVMTAKLMSLICGSAAGLPFQKLSLI